MTLDQDWQAFVANAEASVKVTLSRGNYGPTRVQLAGRLGMCEAVVQHAGAPRIGVHPGCYTALVTTVRGAIQSEPLWGDPAYLMTMIDHYWGWVQAATQRGDLNPHTLDAMVSFGWLARAVFFLSANHLDLANEAGARQIDAVCRVMITTGHMYSAVQLLARALKI